MGVLACSARWLFGFEFGRVAHRQLQLQMKRQILFIQGGGSGAHKVDGELVAHLRSTLGASYEVRYPTMPKERDPDYKRWKGQIRKELAALEGDVILVGHSLGGSFLLKNLSEEKTEATIAGLFLIATPYWGGDGWRYEGFEAVALPEDFASRLPNGVPIFFLPQPRRRNRAFCASGSLCSETSAGNYSNLRWARTSAKQRFV